MQEKNSEFCEDWCIIEHISHEMMRITNTEPKTADMLPKVSLSTVATIEDRVADNKHRNEKGLGWIVTGLFVVGDLAGGGIVALPAAMMQTDFYPGLIMTFIMTAAVTYTAYVLGLSWNILQKRWPEYRYNCRKPYPAMGARAIGPFMGSIVTVCIDITQFGVAVVYMLLSSKNIHDFLQAFFDIDFSFCIIVLILGACLLPITFLKSPQDFWFAVVMAMITTTCAVVLIIVGSGIDYGTCAAEKGVNSRFVLTNYFLAFGTILFSYGGHATFPTIQHDMEKPYQFTRSVILAFIIIFCLYTPVCIMGYVTYGNSLQSSIINSVQTTGIQQAVNILITAHCILSLTITFNPLNQDIEELFRIPHEFCWQRVAVRTGVFVSAVFVAESVPTFGPLLDLVGGSTVALTALVFPCLFYLYLAAADEKALEAGVIPSTEHDIKPPTFTEVLRRTPKIRLAICVGVIVLALIGGVAANYSAIRELATTKFAVPCYVQPFLGKTTAVNLERHTNCCGNWQNISTSGDTSVCSPYVDFYNQA